MESEADLEGFIQQIRTTPLSREMIGLVLNRLNAAESSIAAAEALPEGAEGDPGLEYVSPDPELLSVSADSPEPIVVNDPEPEPLHQQNDFVEPSRVSAMSLQNNEDTEGEEIPRVAPQNCPECERLRRENEELKRRLAETECPVRENPEGERMLKYFGSESLDDVSDSELDSAERRLKLALDQLHEEKESVLSP